MIGCGITSEIFAESKRIFIQGGSGGLVTQYPYISPANGLANLLSLSSPLENPFLPQLLAVGLYERKMVLKSEHITLGYEQSFTDSPFFWRIALTNSKYKTMPYNKYLELAFFNYYFNGDVNKDNFQKTLGYSLLAFTGEYQSREITGGVYYETNNFEIGLKYEKLLVYRILAQIGFDGGLGYCSVRESCTSYTLSPFLGMSIKFENISYSFLVYKRYTWIEFGPNSYNLNLFGIDSYMVNVSKDLDFTDEKEK